MEAPCLSTVWFALSQPYHLGLTVGVPLTVHLHTTVGADRSWGCPFILIPISPVGVAPTERLWSWPLLLCHHRQRHHLGGGEWACALVLQESCNTKAYFSVTESVFHPCKQKQEHTNACHHYNPNILEIKPNKKLYVLYIYMSVLSDM